MTSSSKIPKMMVGGKQVSIEEYDSLRDAVCLLQGQSKDKSKQWSGYGFYANVKTKKHGKTLDINCIITTYDDIFLKMEEHGVDMVAVFHHEIGGKRLFKLPLVPFKLLAHKKRLRLDYALIFIDESKMNAKGVKPILVDSSQLPDVQSYDKVFTIHHPGEMRTHYSEDKARRVTKSSIKYLAKTLKGPPGSPVFVWKDSKLLLVAIHHKNKAEGVLVSCILNHLHIPSVLSKLPVPRRNPFVRALTWLSSPFRREIPMTPSMHEEESCALSPLMDLESCTWSLSMDLDSSMSYREEIYTLSQSMDLASSTSVSISEVSSTSVSISEAILPFSELTTCRTPVKNQTTKLSDEEITEMSCLLGVDWDNLAGLLDVPYSDREEIRDNHQKYPDSYSKAEQIFTLFNDSQYFGRRVLEKYLKELDRPDVIRRILPVENEDKQEQSFPSVPLYEIVFKDTPLSPREMYKLSQRIVLDWDDLAALMDVTKKQRDNIRFDSVYRDERARAEKILSIINCKKDFSREKLTICLEGTGRQDLIDPIVTGAWRKGPKSDSMRPSWTQKINFKGGVIEAEITFKADQGCLVEDTEVVMEKDYQYYASKSLIDLDLVDAVPRVFKFSPDGLKFSKPADLTIKFEKTASESERFILHGFYNPIYQRIIWELLTNGVEEYDEEGIIHAKINSFSLFMFILSTRGKLARILSHLNHSFTCLAYSFFRRSPSNDTVDISVVLLSEFVDDEKENDIRQLQHHFEAGFVKGEKGMLKRVNTHRHLEMCLQFPGIEMPPYQFRVDQPELDSVGFVIDHFKKIAVKSPAHGEVRICEMQRRDENESLWVLNVDENNEEIEPEVVQELYAAPDNPPLPEVVNRTTKLTNEEIAQMSSKLGVDWANLAALMDIPYCEREEIRVNYGKYPSFLSKAKQVLKLFNDSECFDRNTLIKYLEELKLNDLKEKMLPMDDQSESEDECTGETATLRPEISEVQLQNDTPLSSREMYTLSRHLVVTWDRLAALLGITSAERDDIRYSLLYTSSHSKAEKMLAIFNTMEDFSRQKLTECLQEIGQLELKEPVITGEWRR